MANLTDDFITLVRIDFKEALKKPERFVIQKMEEKPKATQKLESINLKMKLRCKCADCNRTWTSFFGTSIWYYYFTARNDMKLKVHVYS